jgi:glycosyltransferase involved in cell wall biosynthesis
MFTDYFFPELGGIQDSIMTMSRALGQRGHRIDIYAPRYAPADYGRIGAAARERDLGANVRVRRRVSLPFPSSTRQSRAAAPSPVGWARLAGRARPDVIHVHSFFGIGLEAIFNGACLGIPVIGTNHTTIAGFAPFVPLPEETAAAYVSWFYNRCDMVTAPSRSVFSELGTWRLRRPQRVISNPIDTALFRPLRDGDDEGAALRSRFGLSGPTITYAGRLGPEKNIATILRALAILRDRGLPARLAIAGHGSDEARLKRLAGELGVAAHVGFAGTLAQDELARLLRASDVFALMSTSETQSMVLLQAMASGIPVVAADSRALPEFVGPANGMLVGAQDAEALAAALAVLIAAPERRRRLGRAGRRLAEQYAIEAISAQWEALYRTACRENG